MKGDLEKEVQSDMSRLRATIRMLDSMPGRLDDHEEGHLRAFTGMLEEMVSGKRTNSTTSLNETSMRLSVDATSCYKN